MIFFAIFSQYLLKEVIFLEILIYFLLKNVHFYKISKINLKTREKKSWPIISLTILAT